MKTFGWWVAYVVSVLLFLGAVCSPLFLISSLPDITTIVLYGLGCSFGSLILGVHVGIMTQELIDAASLKKKGD